MENLGQLQSDLFLAQRAARKYPSPEADEKVAAIEATIAALSDDALSEDPGTGKQALAKAPAEKKAKPAADAKKKEKVTPAAPQQMPEEELSTQSSTTSDESTATPASGQTGSQTPTQTSEPS